MNISLPELLPSPLHAPKSHPHSGPTLRKGAAAASADGFGEWAGLRGRSIELSGYSGPLDLLLKLIRKNEVDIYDIPIASITEQYLAEIGLMEKRDLVVAGDFLLLAATLLEIKSAMMLPRPPLPEGDEEGIDPRAELVQHLLEYQAFQVAAEEFGRLEAQRRMVYGRPFFAAVLQEYGPAPAPAPNLNLDALSRSLQRVLERLEEEGEPITSIPRQKMGLRLRIAGVLADLEGAGREGMRLEELVRPLEGKLFVIVTFLALLELLRSGRIMAQETDGGASHRFWTAGFGREDGGVSG
ncbi:MAG: segregation/condensation protein A [Armatimonadota bacterium]|nr:segregation/condensation protein A [Armatimonadota bacterium]